MNPLWIVNKTANKTAEILLYGYIGSDDVSASAFVKELKALAEENDTIHVRINSGGGSVFEGLAIFNALLACKAETVAYIDGLAASMATVVAMGCKKICMSKIAKFMTHSASGFQFGNAKSMRESAQLLESIDQIMCSIYADRTGKTPEQCKKDYLAKGDRWFSADEAFAEKLIDEVYDAVPLTIPATATSEEQIWAHFNEHRFAAILQQNQNPDMKQINLTPAITAALNITDSSDQGAIEAALTGLVQKAANADKLQGQVTQLTTEKAAAETALENVKKETATAKVKDILDSAIAAKKITAELRAKLEKQYEGKPDELKDIVDSLPAIVSITSQITPGGQEGGEDFASQTWAQLDKAGKLPQLKEKNIELFKQKYEAHFGKPFVA
jgi:ATP-dependent protease ClpP protease subunit